MSAYQTEIYEYYEEIENNISKKQRARGNKQSEIYKTYTRQASNFVFPAINDIVTGENRPRPSKFKIGNKELELILKTKDMKMIKEKLSSQSQGYFKMLDTFRNSFDEYLQKIYNTEKNTNKNIEQDIENFKKYKTFDEFFDKENNKSELIKALLTCSRKFVNIIFNIFQSTGPVLVYTNYVLMEGIDMFKIYLKYFGYDNYKSKNTKPFFSYSEYHNSISREERKESINLENEQKNKYGEFIKVVIFSPAAAEGISLQNIKQVHIVEPYYHEVRIIQMIGRAVRQCSHKDLPMADRQVIIYRYRSVKHNIKIKEIKEGQTVRKETIKIENPTLLRTVDFEIEDLARTKQNLIDSFLDAVKEVAIDCELFKNHNMMMSKYRCFQFNEISLFDKNIGPAYKEDILEDMKLENGSNSVKSVTIKVKAIKIKGILENDKNAENYWYSAETGTIYDFDLYYPVGKVKQNIEGIPIKVDKDTYQIDLLHIPLIK
jgi:superfamily II DNA or RNA helicase